MHSMQFRDKKQTIEVCRHTVNALMSVIHVKHTAPEGKQAVYTHSCPHFPHRRMVWVTGSQIRSVRHLFLCEQNSLRSLPTHKIFALQGDYSFKNIITNNP
jgi:hypothetical protein